MAVGVSTGMIVCSLASGQDKASPTMNLCGHGGESCLWLLTKPNSMKNRVWKMLKCMLICFVPLHFFIIWVDLCSAFLCHEWTIYEWVWEQMLTVLYLSYGQISFLSVSVCNCSLWRNVGERKIWWTCCFCALKLRGLNIVTVRSFFILVTNDSFTKRFLQVENICTPLALCCGTDNP